MHLGMLLRNSGPPSTATFIADCARAGDASELDHLWVLDHVAIPPAESEGSGGRYVDALATLAFVAGITSRIGIGTSVLVVPYRPALATANWIAAIQELSQGRLNLGVGAGWMTTEFIVSEVSRQQRGKITDETLAFVHQCFANDVVSYRGEEFIFSPRPSRPPILVGGQGDAALRRVVQHGDGWMPTTGEVDKLRQPLADLRARMLEAGKSAPIAIPLTKLNLDDLGAGAAELAALAEIGCTGVAHAARYETVDEFKRIAQALQSVRERAAIAAT